MKTFTRYNYEELSPITNDDVAISLAVSRNEIVYFYENEPNPWSGDPKEQYPDCNVLERALMQEGFEVVVSRWGQKTSGHIKFFPIDQLPEALEYARTTPFS